MLRYAPIAAAVTLLMVAPCVARAQAEADAALPPGPFGAIVCEARGVRVQLTAEDAAWAARMLVGESGGADDADNAAVLWCMLNSYALRPVRDAYPTFGAFIRAYCTPLQPFLKSQGAIDRHRKRGTPMVEVEPGKWQLKRHVELQQRPWAKLPQGARALVERALTGRMESACGNATQFCSTAVYFHDANGRKPSSDEHAAFTHEFARKKKWVWAQPQGTKPTSNCFFEELRFQQLPKPAVRVEAPPR